jgi:hypothetical protein
MMVKQRASRKTALIMAPSTSALAYPYVFFSHGLDEMCMEKKATERATTSDSMWKASATSALELEISPTMSSTSMKEKVRVSMHRRRFFWEGMMDRRQERFFFMSSSSMATAAEDGDILKSEEVICKERRGRKVRDCVDYHATKSDN